ncbi:MAG: hypothetical protein K2N87_01980 [Eubacterium sp.]|nr:hypothetical protein [Eubacterium sp.]
MKHAKKHIPLALSGTILAGCLTWSAVSFAPENNTFAADKRANIQKSYLAQEQEAVLQEELDPSCVAYACETNDADSIAEWQQRFQIYEPFGLTYDAAKDELRYHGKLVRCFEDYYPLDDTGETSAGTDFFQENGVTDVYAVRDLKHITKNADGSYDPSGKLTGLREATKEEFAARDIEPLKNPPSAAATAISEDPVSAEDMMELAAEYQPFGVTYHPATDQWFFHGERVRRFEDILLSNGQAPGSGNFSGSIRSSFDENGSVDIYTVRDFTRLNENGDGTLTAIKKM